MLVEKHVPLQTLVLNRCSPQILQKKWFGSVPSIFKSAEHPGDAPSSAVYSRALARPIGAFLAPIMLGAAAAALQGDPVWGYLLWGLPGALIAATLWTQFRLMRTPAELHLRPGQAAVQSVHEVVHGRPRTWHPLHHVRAGRWDVELSVGWRTYSFRPAEWPNYEELREAAREALRTTQEAASDSTTTPSRE